MLLLLRYYFRFCKHCLLALLSSHAMGLLLLLLPLPICSIHALTLLTMAVYGDVFMYVSYLHTHTNTHFSILYLAPLPLDVCVRVCAWPICHSANIIAFGSFPLNCANIEKESKANSHFGDTLNIQFFVPLFSPCRTIVA